MTVRDPELYGSPETVRHLLLETTTWAVVGVSASEPERDAYRIAKLLQDKGKRIVPVHPRAETVHGETGYASLAEAQAAVGHIEVVDLFVNSRRVGGIIDDAIAIGADAVWGQLTVIDEDAARRARDAGLAVVMDRCPAIEWPRLSR